MQVRHHRLVGSLLLGLAVGCASTTAVHEFDTRPAVFDPDLPALTSGTAPTTLQDAAAAEQDSWQAIAAVYVWALGIDGDVTIRGREAEVDIGFDDILDNAEFGFMGRVEAWQDTWGLFFEPLLLNLSEGGSLGPVAVDVDVDFTVLEGGGFYRLSDKTNTNGRRTMIDVLGGVRYYEIEGDLDIMAGPLAGQVGDDPDWLDPFIGARMIKDLSENWVFSMRGDVGGFDIDNTSDFALNLQALFGRTVGTSTSLWVGYRLLDIDYDDGSGNDRFEWDTTTQGPLVGIATGF